MDFQGGIKIRSVGNCNTLDCEFCPKQFIEGKTSRKVDYIASLLHKASYYPFDPREFMNLNKLLT